MLILLLLIDFRVIIDKGNVFLKQNEDRSISKTFPKVSAIQKGELEDIAIIHII